MNRCFPGRTHETDDTHAHLRPKYIRLAQLLDAVATKGALAIGWMDCVFNQIPHPHGQHVHSDTLALYPAGRRNKARPSYLLNLRSGDIELHEIVDFIMGSSKNDETKSHIATRLDAIGNGGLDQIRFPSFEESLAIDEKLLTSDELGNAKEEL